MLITEFKIRKIIRQLLKEDVSDPTIKAAEMGLALCSSKERGQEYVFLYDPKVILNAVENNKEEIERHEVIGNALKACVSLYPGAQTMMNYSHPVNYSFAIPGLKIGPAAYDCALWIAQNKRFEKIKKNKNGLAKSPPGGVTPDRINVSASAKNVWKNYSLRNDVESYDFDDMDDPITVDKWDDDERNHKEDYLNKSYVLKKEPVKFQELQNNHNNLLNSLMRMKNESARWYLTNLSSGLRALSSKMFDEIYYSKKEDDE